jgi:hypothetical protein
MCVAEEDMTTKLEASVGSSKQKIALPKYPILTEYDVLRTTRLREMWNKTQIVGA